ncbi:MAG: carboxypeptidase regulatory-like domain-containing protein [Deltaproteobacteria bacterium]|nr:carboxypeptidase regulatory-like domain-containing protein [Deltaproteobacteria bacterium]
MTRRMTERQLGLLCLLGLSAACDSVEPLVRPGATIAGVVCDSLTGRPRQGVEVSCRVGEHRVDVESDATGSFVCPNIAVTELEATVRIDEGGERKARRYQVEITPGEQSEIHDTACREGPGEPGLGDIDGRVCNRHTGELIVHADVSLLLSVDGEEEVRTQQSSGEPDPGRFFFAAVPVGEWVIVIDAAGFHRTVGVTVEEGQVAEVDLGVCEDDDLTGEGEGEGEGEPGDTGGVSGHVCTFDGTSLGGATVSVTMPDGSVRSVTSNDVGDWLMLDLPPGEYTFRVQAGSYSAERTVTVTAGSVVDLPDDECELDQDDVRIAVIEGSWDDVYSVLVNVGVDPSIVDNYPSYGGAQTLLGDPALLATYDVVMINCGADEYDFQSDPVLRQNLEDYVLAGGNLYASDLAYDFVEQTFPGFIEFFGDDPTFDSAQVGVEGDVPATILDSFLATAIGRSSITLHYPYAIWAIVTGTSSGVRVLIRGNGPYDDSLGTGGTGTISNIPHTLLFHPGGATGGKVVYSSFHQEPGINVDQERILQLLMFQL